MYGCIRLCNSQVKMDGSNFLVPKYSAFQVGAEEDMMFCSFDLQGAG